MINITWTITPASKKLLDEISALNLIFQKYHPRPESLSLLRRQSILKSAVYSARIENIPAHIEDPLVFQKIEIQNLVSAYNYVFSSSAPDKISLSLLKHLHSLVLKNLSPQAGSWRTEPWAIYNQSGIAVYLAPAHFKLPELMPEYVSFIKSLKEPAPVISGIAQFALEKLHPFADGNGRVGRLVSAFLLERSGFGSICEFEEYVDKSRDTYYRVLEPNQNCTDFIEYFLTGLVESAGANLDILKNPPVAGPEIRLLPRRREILNIIRDHPLVSFDFLFRRFTGINPKSLHHDLLVLQKAGFIIKHGVSRGSVYSSASS
jgi:Fic family protein